MKKRHLLLCLFAMLLGVSTSVFAQKGTSRADAIDFDLKNQTLYQDAGSLWYKMDLSGFGDDAIGLHVSNQSGEEVQISAAVYTSIDASSAQKNTSGKVGVNKDLEVTITAGLNKLYPTIYLYLTSSERVAISAEKVETEPGVGCLFPVEMPFNASDKKWESVLVNANDTKTLRVDGLKTLKSIEPEEINGVATVWGLKVSITNLGAKEANVKASLALTCGAPLQDISKSVPAGQTKSTSIKYSMLKQVTADSVFVEVDADQDIRIAIEGDPQIATVVRGAESAVHVDFDTPVTTQKAATEGTQGNVDSTNRGEFKHWFRIFIKEGESKAAKMSNDSVLKIVYTNLTATALEISEKYKYSSASNEVMSEDIYKLPANGTASHSMSPVQIRQLKADSIFYFINSNKDGKFTVEWKLDAAEPGSICRTAIGYTLPETTDEVISFTHNTANAVWYKIDYQSALDTIAGAIKLTIKNNTAKSGTMSADIKFDCDGSATPQSKGISAGQSMSKTIGHALLDAYSGNGNHEIFVALTTDLNVTVSAQLVYEKVSNDYACMNAQNVAVVVTNPQPTDNKFDFVAAGKDTAWYYIDLSDIQQEGHESDLKVVLTAAGSVKVDAALTFSCPAGSMQEKSLSFSNSYEKTISYSQIKGLKNPYVRIIAAKSVHAELTPVAPKLSETNLCGGDSAVVEVKTDGSVNNPEGKSTWYHINVDQLRETMKTARVYVNTTSPSQKFSVATLDTCYSKFELAYQDQTAGGGRREITADRLDLIGAAKELYINVIAENAYSFTIEIEDIPVGSDCEHAEVFEANKLYTQNAGEAKWFKVKVADLRALGQNATMTLKNLDGTYTSMNAEVYNKCNGTQLGTQKVGLAANDLKVKSAGLAGYPDSVLLYVETTGNVTYRLDLVNETGESCAEAILFDWKNGHVVAGGSEMWLNVMFAGNIDPNNGDSVVIHVDNLSVNDAKIKAGVAYSCAEGVVQSGSRIVGGNKGMERDVTSLIGSRDSVLVHVASDQAVRVWAEIVKMEPLDEPITVCNGQLLTYNTWYNVVANQPDQWFRISIKDLQENTIGDGTFRIQSDEDANFKAEVSYVCPVYYPMTSKTLQVEGGEEYKRVVTRSDINSMSNDSAYIRVTSNKDARFQLEIQDLAGYDCERAIEYVWGSKFENPAFGTKWYKIPFVDILRDQHTGVKFHFENPNAGDSIKVEAHIYGGCPEDGYGSLKDTTLMVAPNFLKESYLNHNRVEGLADGISLDTVFMSIFSENIVNFSAVPYAEVENLDENVYCPGEEIDAYGNVYVVDDVMVSENKKLGHKVFTEEYPFTFGGTLNPQTIYVDVDSTYIFDGNMFELPELTAADFTKLPIAVAKYFGDEPELFTELADADVEDFITAWNDGDDDENDIVNAKLGNYSWELKNNTTATLTIEGLDCEDFVLDLVIPFYEGTETTVVVPSCVSLLDLLDTVYVDADYEDAYVVNVTHQQPDNVGILDGSDLNITKYPIKVNGVVDGIAICNADAQAAADAYNATNPSVRAEQVLGWNATGDTLSILSSCGDTLRIAQVIAEVADSNLVVETIVDDPQVVYLCEGEVAPADLSDTIFNAPLDTVTTLVYTQSYTVITGNYTVTNTTYTVISQAIVENSGFVPTAKVEVGKHLEGLPTYNADAVIAEVTTFVNDWNAQASNSPIAPENFVVGAVDLVNFTVPVSITDDCGSTLNFVVDAQIYDVEVVESLNETSLYDCAPSVDQQVDSTVVLVPVGSITYDRLLVDTVRTIYNQYASVATADLTIGDVYFGMQVDGTTNSTLADLQAYVDGVVAAWNAVEGNAPATATINQTDVVKVTLTDSCGNVNEKTAAIVLYPVVKNDPVVNISYDCAADVKNDTNEVVSPKTVNGVTYDVVDVTIDIVLEKSHIILPDLDLAAISAVCGETLDIEAVKAQYEAAANALVVDSTVAGGLVFNWTVKVDGVDYVAGSALAKDADIEVTVRAVDECNVALAEKSATTAPVAKQIDENVDALSFPLIVDYKGLLVINLNEIEQQLNITLDSADVEWYVVGNDAAPVWRGYYYTPQSKDDFEAFKANSYYVKFNGLSTVNNGCETYVVSQVIVGTVSSAPVFITPNAVNPGEAITLYNLDGEQATLSVYDMMGNLVSSEQINGVYTYSFNAQYNPGYYVVKVINGDRVQSLKYVVK